VVGTGGESHYPIVDPIANSKVHNDDTYGVLKLTLHPKGYEWRFVPVEGRTFTDSGSARATEEMCPDKGKFRLLNLFRAASAGRHLAPVLTTNSERVRPARSAQVRQGRTAGPRLCCIGLLLQTFVSGR
jgi:hypothetical protein